ncbi:tripartite tricarboxylate transporter substrate binding protein [Geomicrobium sp. JCM 19039]|uniref:tripartite tricarboxylate transporter substrate binding protein n=1 Tax=Geomicrobium sp. JCM 19039 TaxID=1460636 RepID=UPI00045F2611|nr:tripartite tricarboxylate transporter substrate binding protein [Geomicrobium sp. JCM 19039]GAK11687.1 tricarboxylate transport protein TctC [Geomicrobium sp. JCM 19039]
MSEKGKKFFLLVSVFSIILIASAFVHETVTPDASDRDIENYPNRDIDVYVGHGPGGGTDIFTRTITNEMSELMGVNFNIINQEGGSGVIAKQSAANQPADGYTLIGMSAFAVTTAAGINQNDLSTLKPIGRVESDIYSLQVREGTFGTIEELVDYADENPGELQFASVGTMGMDEVNARRFMEAADIEMTYVPMDGAGSMHSNLLGGHVDVILEELGPAYSYIESEQVKPLIIFADERVEEFSEIPTTVEYGWNLTDGIERGLMIHRDTPEEIVTYLEEVLYEAQKTRTFEQYKENAFLNFREGWLNSEQYEQKLIQDMELYERILEDL